MAIKEGTSVVNTSHTVKAVENNSLRHKNGVDKQKDWGSRIRARTVSKTTKTS